MIEKIIKCERCGEELETEEIMYVGSRGDDCYREPSQDEYESQADEADWIESTGGWLCSDCCKEVGREFACDWEPEWEEEGACC